MNTTTAPASADTTGLLRIVEPDESYNYVHVIQPADAREEFDVNVAQYSGDHNGVHIYLGYNDLPTTVTIDGKAWHEGDDTINAAEKFVQATEWTPTWDASEVDKAVVTFGPVTVTVRLTVNGWLDLDIVSGGAYVAIEY